VSDVLVLPLSLLIRGILAALRQIFHLSACPNLPGHLCVPPNADTAAARRAMTRLALRYHPDKGGRPEHMTRINAAYENARRDMSARR
jgi:putative hemolysin